MNNNGLSKLYYNIYNDIANYRVFNEDTLSSFKNLTHEECIKLLITYNTIMQTLYEGGFLD